MTTMSTRNPTPWKMVLTVAAATFFAMGAQANPDSLMSQHTAGANGPYESEPGTRTIRLAIRLPDRFPSLSIGDNYKQVTDTGCPLPFLMTFSDQSLQMASCQHSKKTGHLAFGVLTFRQTATDHSSRFELRLNRNFL